MTEKVSILLWRTRWWHPFDAAVSLSTLSVYSHVGWILEDQVVELTRQGSRTSDLEDYPRRYDIGELELDDEQLSRLAGVVSHRRDAPPVRYDWPGAIGIGLRMVSHLRCLRSNPLEDKGRETCSEAVAVDLRAAGLELPHHASAMSPGDISELPYVRVRHL